MQKLEIQTLEDAKEWTRQYLKMLGYDPAEIESHVSRYKSFKRSGCSFLVMMEIDTPNGTKLSRVYL
jgi:hypothetical protein